jgi:hypothetical protein
MVSDWGLFVDLVDWIVYLLALLVGGGWVLGIPLGWIAARPFRGRTWEGRVADLAQALSIGCVAALFLRYWRDLAGPTWTELAAVWIAGFLLRALTDRALWWLWPTVALGAAIGARALLA